MTTDPATEDLGPLERKHLQYGKFRAVTSGAEITTSHWPIALANGLGWTFGLLGIWGPSTTLTADAGKELNAIIA